MRKTAIEKCMRKLSSLFLCLFLFFLNVNAYALSVEFTNDNCSINQFSDSLNMYQCAIESEFSQYVDLEFDSKYNNITFTYTDFWRNSIERCIGISDFTQFWNIQKNKKKITDVLVVINGSQKYGGSCQEFNDAWFAKYVIVVTVNKDGPEMLKHEMGHTFGLDDEYFTDGTSNDCKMGKLYYPFCSDCTRKLRNIKRD